MIRSDTAGRCNEILLDLWFNITYPNHIISALESFCADANGIPRKVHSDFDTKLIGGEAIKCSHKNNSKIIADNAGYQSSNLAECT